jgi:hypothetical protein
MPGPVKTQAVVLRSIRYGEADRIVHLYTPGRGRVGAIAKGARRTRSRFGGRLEPFFRLDLLLHEGRGELLTVTAAETVNGHPRLRADGAALDAAARACDAVARLFETDEPHPEVYNLLCNELALLDADPGPRHALQPARVPPEAAARGRPRAPARGVHGLRRARASHGVLGRGGRRGVQRVRGLELPARRRRARVPRRRARDAARRRAGRVRAGAAPSRACDFRHC